MDEAFEDQINMKNEVDQFIGLSGKAIKSLVSLTVNRLEPALNFMTKTNWRYVRVCDLHVVFELRSQPFFFLLISYFHSLQQRDQSWGFEQLR